MPTLGETLRSTREERRLKLIQVAERTKIPLERLQALESDRYADVPDDVYLNGAIRNYALFLGLNPDEMVRLYRTVRPEQERSRLLDRTRTRRTVAVVPATAAAIVAVLIVLVILLALHVIVL